MSDDNATLPYPKPSAEHETLVIPDAGQEQPPARRRRRWPWVVGILIVVIALLVVAAEFLARSLLPGIVRGIVIEQLDLPADQELDVTAGGILLPQLIGGRLDELRLQADSITVGGITGAADVTATGVGVRGDSLDAAIGTIRIEESQFTALLDGTDLPIDAIAFEGENVTATGAVSVLGMSLPISLTALPGAEEGDVTLTPIALRLGGVEIDADQVADRLGDLGQRITDTQRICIADRLPAGVTLTGLSIDGSEAVIALDVAGGILSDAALQQNGSCG